MPTGNIPGVTCETAKVQIPLILRERVQRLRLRPRIASGPIQQSRSAKTRADITHRNSGCRKVRYRCLEAAPQEIGCIRLPSSTGVLERQ